MADVFISYSSKDREDALQIVDFLEARDVTCWIAPRDIPGGSYYAKEIPKAIDESPVFLLILSKNAQSSDFVLRELDYAASLDRVILPYVIDQADLSREFNFMLRTKQRYHPTDDEHAHLKLLGRIHGICEKPPLPKYMNEVEESDENEAEQEDEQICCPLCGSKRLLDLDSISFWNELEFMEKVARYIPVMLIAIMLVAPMIMYGIESEEVQSMLNDVEEWMSLLKFAAVMALPWLFAKVALWWHEMRRREQVRKHIRIKHFKCKDCAHKFEVAIPWDGAYDDETAFKRHIAYLLQK